MHKMITELEIKVSGKVTKATIVDENKIKVVVEIPVSENEALTLESKVNVEREDNIK